MPGGEVPSGGELFDLLVNGNADQKAIEQAVLKGLESFTETATAEINKLVKANTLGPDVQAEMLELNKTIINQTIEMIKNGPLSPPGSKSE